MNLKTKDLTLCGIFAALISISAYLTIPLPGGVPFSLQPLIAMMAGLFLGSKRGAISMVVYTLMGLVGLPVFAGGTGGYAVIFTPSFGYIIGFIACAYVTGKIIELFSNKSPKIAYIIAPFVGLALDYIIGIPYLYMIINNSTAGTATWSLALTYGFYPFIILDLLKALMVVFMGLSLLPRLKKAGVLV
jgi:biotin transport system substrate-specific component